MVPYGHWQLRFLNHHGLDFVEVDHTPALSKWIECWKLAKVWFPRIEHWAGTHGWKRGQEQDSEVFVEQRRRSEVPWASRGGESMPWLLYRNGRNSSHSPPLVSMESTYTSISFLKRNVLQGWRGPLRSHTSMIVWNHFCISPISSVRSASSVGRNFFLRF